MWKYVPFVHKGVTMLAADPEIGGKQYKVFRKLVYGIVVPAGAEQVRKGFLRGSYVGYFQSSSFVSTVITEKGVLGFNQMSFNRASFNQVVFKQKHSATVQRFGTYPVPDKDWIETTNIDCYSTDQSGFNRTGFNRTVFNRRVSGTPTTIPKRFRIRTVRVLPKGDVTILELLRGDSDA